MQNIAKHRSSYSGYGGFDKSSIRAYIPDSNKTASVGKHRGRNDGEYGSAIGLNGSLVLLVRPALSFVGRAVLLILTVVVA